MAENLGIKKCWFYKDHYDIPKSRIKEIEEQCQIVSPKDIVRIIKVLIMNTKYELSGTIRGTDRRITSYVSSPVGVAPEQFFKSLLAFTKAFDNVKATLL